MNTTGLSKHHAWLEHCHAVTQDFVRTGFCFDVSPASFPWVQLAASPLGVATWLLSAHLDDFGLGPWHTTMGKWRWVEKQTVVNSGLHHCRPDTGSWLCSLTIPCKGRKGPSIPCVGNRKHFGHCATVSRRCCQLMCFSAVCLLLPLSGQTTPHQQADPTGARGRQYWWPRGRRERRRPGRAGGFAPEAGRKTATPPCLQHAKRRLLAAFNRVRDGAVTRDLRVALCSVQLGACSRRQTGRRPTACNCCRASSQDRSFRRRQEGAAIDGACPAGWGRAPTGCCF